MDQTSWAGKLLVATPVLTDPNFTRTVILLLDHGDDGAIGLVLNRPSSLRLAEAMPGWEDVAASPPVLFAGGPVEPDAVIALGRARPEVFPTPEWSPIVDRLRVVDLSAGAEVADAQVEAARVFVGYAGWAPGQLEAEVAADAWFVTDARDLDALADEPDVLWSEVLRRQRGDVALFATFPDDPSLN
ncbi:MAG: YqgE/AlgH family protein [Actinobacteria bacterium]|nr:YqgE/AlgH family protein [Actinomycetota bacterium]